MADLAYNLDPPSDQDLLSSAEGLVRSLCGWHIAPVRTEDVTIQAGGEQTLVLPTLRLVAASVTVDGETVDSSEFTVDPAGVLRKVCDCWWGTVVVTMTHGYFEAPPEVTSLVQSLAQRAKSGKGQVASWTRGPFSETYTTPALSPDQATLDRYSLPPRP